MHAATLITGGSNGIGRAILMSRLQLGETVLNLDRIKPETLDGTQFYQTDLGNDHALQETLLTVVKEYDVTRVVNCAGIATVAALDELSMADFDKTMKVNVLAPALIVKAVLPAMKAANFGRVVNISSRSAMGRTLRTAYASSKGALIAATRVWALELAEFGITVNAIGPGPIETELYRSANPPESPVTQKVIASVPVKRLGRPEDIASAVDYFLSEDASFVTGQVLYVCGGLTIGGVAA